MREQKLLYWLMIGLLLAGLGLVVSPALAAGGLPDRSERDNNRDSGPPGAAIELTAWPPGGTSVVQWQDINGNWHDVDGWRGVLDSNGYIRWWVAAKDFGSGPFRWVVGQAASEPFNLPAGAGQTVRIDLTASPE
ncbi:MAG: hypothetical protein Kow0031_11970 [Anaerolineae bacterium]